MLCPTRSKLFQSESLVYDCIYKTRVNAMTGTVISSSVEDLL